MKVVGTNKRARFGWKSTVDEMNCSWMTVYFSPPEKPACQGETACKQPMGDEDKY
jgi:hypothetical protein